MIKWLMCCCGFLLCACSTTKPATKLDPGYDLRQVEQQAKEKFEDNFFILNNETKSFSLVKSKTKKFSEIGFDISYFIFDNQTSEIIREGFLKSGYIDWVKGNTLKIVDRKIGADNKRDKEVYLFNAKTKEREDL